jgi:hypothetical protein
MAHMRREHRGKEDDQRRVSDRAYITREYAELFWRKGICDLGVTDRLSLVENLSRENKPALLDIGLALSLPHESDLAHVSCRAAVGRRGKRPDGPPSTLQEISLTCRRNKRGLARKFSSPCVISL